MSKDAREFLEEIAVDMIYLSMEYIGKSRFEILEEARSLTDEELYNFVTNV